MNSNYALKVLYPFIIIYDLNMGNKSVTNDMERIVATLKKRFNLVDYILIYRDSESKYCGVNVSNDSSDISFHHNPTLLLETLGVMYLNKIYEEEIL